MTELIIDGRVVNDSSDCYTIAEIGHNHMGDISVCREMFRVAKECGADAVKLQKRNNKTLFTKESYDREYDNPVSYGKTYGEHREFLEFEEDEYTELKEYAKELDITFFATAFDIPSADFLEKIDVPAFKIASGDLKNIPLLKHVAKFGKAMVVSTGGGSMEDVVRAYEAVKPINPNFTILQCVAGYPPEHDEMNLKVIQTFRERFPDIVVGLSSHDNGILMPVVAYMLGARVVEKHFTLNRAAKGTDHSFSLTPIGFRKMVRDLKRARVSLGDGVKRVQDSEKAPIEKMGKKLVAAHDLKVGHVLIEADIAFKSPGDGLPPYEIDKVLGQTLKVDLLEDDAISFEALEL